MVRVRDYTRYDPVMTETAKEARARGKSSEREVIEKLKLSFPNSKFKESTEFEDITYDIDFWWDDVPVSIKTQHKAIETGNLSFELRKKDRTGAWHSSWFLTGTAKLYIFVFGKRIGIVNKEKLSKYLDVHNFERIITNSPAIVAREIASRNKFVDAQNGLIAFKTLEKEGLIDYV